MSAEAYSLHGPQCPFCKHTILPDDAVYYDEQNYTEEDCPACGKTFTVSVDTTVAWSTSEPEAEE